MSRSASTTSSWRPQRLAPWVHRTPVMTSRALDARTGAAVFLKCENFQKVGAFKFRGAMNAVLQLSDEARRAGVITHSSGNHAQALALAGQLLRCAGDGRDAAHRPGREARRDRGLRCQDRPLRADVRLARDDRRRRDRAPWLCAGSSVQRLERDRRPGDRRAGAARPGRCARHGDLPGRRRRLACRDRAGGQGSLRRPRGSSAPSPPGPTTPGGRSRPARSSLSNDPSTIADGLRTTSIGERTFAVIRRTCRTDRRRRRGRDHRRHAVRLGADQDRDRAIERRRGRTAP